MNKAETYTMLLAIIVVLAGIILVSLWPAEAKSKPMPEAKRKIIKLSQPLHDSNTSLEEALLKRRSIRDYRDKPLTLAEISQLLWAAQGITHPGGYRTAPSAGALYPLELYVVAGNVDGLSDGIYRYQASRHELEQVATGDKRTALCLAAWGQSAVRKGGAVLVISAVYKQTTVKYGERGVRYIHMEAGHAAQNLNLQAVSLNLGTVVIGAFHDKAVKKLLGMSEREQPLYIIPVGRR